TLEASIASSAVFGGDAGAVQQALVDLTLGKAGLDLPLSFSMAYVEAKGDATVTLRDTAVLAATDDISISALAERTAGAELAAGGTSSVNLSAGFARVTGTTLVDIQSGAQLDAGNDIQLVAAAKTAIAMNSAAAGETDDESGEANVASVVFAGSQSDVTTAVKVGAGAVLTSGGDTHVQAFHAGSYDTAAEVTVYGDGAAGVVGALSLQKTDTSVAVDGTVNAGGDVRVLALNAVA